MGNRNGQTGDCDTGKTMSLLDSLSPISVHTDSRSLFPRDHCDGHLSHHRYRDTNKPMGITSFPSVAVMYLYILLSSPHLHTPTAVIC